MNFLKPMLDIYYEDKWISLEVCLFWKSTLTAYFCFLAFDYDYKSLTLFHGLCITGLIVQTFTGTYNSLYLDG